MSRRDSDSEKVPAALYDRLTDTPTYAARMYKVQLRGSFHEEFRYGPEQVAFGLRQAEEDTLVAGSAARPVR